MKGFKLFILFIFITSAGFAQGAGFYRGIFKLPNGSEVPFNFEIKIQLGGRTQRKDIHGMIIVEGPTLSIFRQLAAGWGATAMTAANISWHHPPVSSDDKHHRDVHR